MMYYWGSITELYQKSLSTSEVLQIEHKKSKINKQVTFNKWKIQSTYVQDQTFFLKDKIFIKIWKISVNNVPAHSGYQTTLWLCLWKSLNKILC